MKKFSGLDEFVAAEGTELGPTDWLEVTQDRVNVFADATDDHQWIHVDPERAANGRHVAARHRHRFAARAVHDQRQLAPLAALDCAHATEVHQEAPVHA